MKKLLLLPVFLVLLACKRDCPSPTPAPTPSAVLAPIPGPFTPGPGVALWLGVRDAKTNERFQPVMTGFVYFYPPNWTEAEVRTQAVFDERVGWLLAPTPIWQSANIQAGPAWHADKTVLLSVRSEANVVILWQFPEGDRAHPRYSQYYQYVGVLTKETHVDITIDRQLAGL